jgi:hypothetical protein
MTKITREALEALGPLEAAVCQHKHFGTYYDGPPRSLDQEEKHFYFSCLSEEVGEYLMAENLEDEYDALLDLLVFTLGALVRQGLPLDGLSDVIYANLQKVVGPVSKRGGYKFDLQKPEGWTPPDLSRYLS